MTDSESAVGRSLAAASVGVTAGHWQALSNRIVSAATTSSYVTFTDSGLPVPGSLSDRDSGSEAGGTGPSLPRNASEPEPEPAALSKYIIRGIMMTRMMATHD